jgi:hypothetical protein
MLSEDLSRAKIYTGASGIAEVKAGTSEVRASRFGDAALSAKGPVRIISWPILHMIIGVSYGLFVSDG